MPSKSGELPIDHIVQGDAQKVLEEWPDNSIHCVVTSPPYWNLKDYGVDGQIGLEDTVADYIDDLLAVFKEIQRVLRSDGNLWVNLGDTYERKDKQFVPHQVALALREQGWLARNDVVWQKTNPMPESVTDRLSTTHEFLFHFVEQRNYFYDLDAIREPYKESSLKRAKRDWNGETNRGDPNGRKEQPNPEDFVREDGKNPGDVIETSTANCSESHFAVFPDELVTKPIRAGCPPRVCRACGTPHERCDGQWQPQCGCEAEWQPGIVLDPFAGTGTALRVARDEGRRFVGIELSKEYTKIARNRVGRSGQNSSPASEVAD